MTQRPGVWRVLVPVVALLAGLLLVTTAHTAHGTNLRSQQTNIADLIRSAEAKNLTQDAKVRQLQAEVASRTDALARSDAGVAAIKAGSSGLLGVGGLTSVTGPGLSVTLDDAPRRQTNASATDNDLVVHQSDLQAVMNALWAGGAEAMTLMGQRLIATSAVRCVGNTLLLNGRLFSPPFSVAAIGPADQMRTGLDQSVNVSLYRGAVRDFGLGYDVADQKSIQMPAYDLPIGLSYAQR